MTILAFMAAPAKADVETQPPLPTFKPRWWYDPNRLDARPVIWSLENRPEEWECHRPGIFLHVRHKPSGHDFVADTVDTGLVDDSRCGCRSLTNGRFQIFQSWLFRHAANALDESRRAARDPAHFASHFVR